MEPGFCLAEFRQDAGIKCNLKKLAACTSVFSLLRRVSAAAFRKLASGKFFSVGPACSTGGEPTDEVSACTRLHTSWKCLHFHDIRAKPSAVLHWASCCVACILGRGKEEIGVEKRKSKKVKLGEK